jgi:hypothetical protein
MDFNSTIIEVVATLEDPFFACAFIVTSLVLASASFTAILFFGDPRPWCRAASGAAALVAVLGAFGTRNAIPRLANLLVDLVYDDSVVIGYWYTRPYVWSAWGIAGLAALAAIVIRARRAGAQLDRD